MEGDMEIGFEKARKLAKNGRCIYVFLNNSADLELVREVLGARDNVQGMDTGKAIRIMSSEGDKSTIEGNAKKFEDSVIICPHGRISLEFVRALSGLGIKAHSLDGGIEGLKSRAQRFC